MTMTTERYAAVFDIRSGELVGVDRYCRDGNGGWFHHSDGSGSSETCEHLHRTRAAAERCGVRGPGGYIG